MTFADFQDLIAFYLRDCLPPEQYEILLDKKIGDVQPDIVIRKDSVQYISFWRSKQILAGGGQGKDDSAFSEETRKRISALAARFGIPSENILYVFEDHGNVGLDFSSLYWDKDSGRKERSTIFPYNIIYPLFNGTDPYYWEHEKNFNRNVSYKAFSDQEILQKGLSGTL